MGRFKEAEALLDSIAKSSRDAVTLELVEAMRRRVRELQYGDPNSAVDRNGRLGDVAIRQREEQPSQPGQPRTKVSSAERAELELLLDVESALANWFEQRRKNARKSVRLDPKILEAYVGQYQFEEPPNRILTVSREGGRLFINWPRDFKSELFAEAESKFFFKVRPFQLILPKIINRSRIWSSFQLERPYA